MKIQFELPYWFLLIPALIILYFIKQQYFSDKNRNHTSSQVTLYYPDLPEINATVNPIKTGISKYFYWLILFLMITALAQPVIKIKQQQNPDTLKDIIFVIDTSVGMSINDYVLNDKAVDRLTLLKAVLSDFIKKLEGNRIGIMVYADSAYVLAPLTRDKALLDYSIKRIQPALAGRQNNLSNALNSAINQFDFKKQTPSIIVLSQGANLQSDISPLHVAEKLQEKNIKMHFIGIGTNKENLNSKVKLIFDPIDNKLLQQMAATTKGEFFWAGKTGSFDSILSRIKETESINIKKPDIFQISNYYDWLLSIVVALILSISFISTILVNRK